MSSSNQSDTDAAIHALNATVIALSSQVANLLNLTTTQASQIEALTWVQQGVSTVEVVDQLWQINQNNNDGDNAWMLTATALVYIMTPAVAFFYGGMVHRKNILGTLLLCFLCMAIVTVQWILFGFSLAFGPHGGNVLQLGGWNRKFLVTEFGFVHDPNYSPTYPLYTYCMFQCAFAVITPALISGALVNKMKITSFCVFVLLWTTLVYDVIAFWVWNPEGWLKQKGSLDWAGGVVIHISSGFSALMATAFFDIETGAVVDPQPAWTVLGGGILWFGWLGFNGGSYGNGGPMASLSFLNTNAGAAAAAMTWAFLEYVHMKKTSAPGVCVGAVVGLVVITPAAGFVRPGWALLMCIWGTAMVYGVVCFKRAFLKVDDPLDVWTCHGAGGVFGALLTGLFAQRQRDVDGSFLNSGDANGSFYGHSEQFAWQLVAVVSCIAYSMTGTALIMIILKYTMGIKVSKLENALGMDGPMVQSAERQKEELVTGVLQRAITIFSGEKELKEFTREEEGVLQDVFHLFDADGGGTITVDEFHKALTSMGLSRPRKEVMQMFAQNGIDSKGHMNFEQFKTMFLQHQLRVRQASEAKGKPQVVDDVEMV